MSSSTPSTMRTISYTRYGGPDVMELLERPVPELTQGQVLIRVTATALNPVDARQREGTFKMITPQTFPLVGGNELSGEVVEVTPGVPFSVGDKVIARVDKNLLGAFAEYAAVDAGFVAKAPTKLPLADAAGLPLAGLTAYQGLDVLEVTAGDHVLITAGAGGVGLLAIQLAKLRGAHVTTTASSRGAALVTKAGADTIIDYTTTKLDPAVHQFDQVFDMAGGDDAAMVTLISCTKPGGKVITVSGPVTPAAFDEYLSGLKWLLISSVLSWKSRAVRAAAAKRGVSYEFFFMRPDGPQLAQLAGYVDDGKLDLVIDSRFDMADYAKAFERLESKRSKGKVVVRVRGAAGVQ